MEVWGLTGGIGSGKTTVCNLLEEYGIPVVSADELARIVVAPGTAGLEKVVEAFGPEVLDETGGLDRRKVGRLVFGNRNLRKELEAILHPLIRERFDDVVDALEKAGHRVMVYEVPLLFEKALQLDLAGIVLVTAPDELRLSRVMSRDDLSSDEVQDRMRAQLPEAEKRKLADVVIDNDGDLDQLRLEVERLLATRLQAAPARELTAATKGADETQAGPALPRARAITESLPQGSARPEPAAEPLETTLEPAPPRTVPPRPPPPGPGRGPTRP